MLVFPFDTDHKVLEADFKIRWKLPPKDPPMKKPDYRTLRDPTRAAEFARNVLALPNLDAVRNEAPLGTPWMSLLTCALLRPDEYDLLPNVGSTTDARPIPEFVTLR